MSRFTQTDLIRLYKSETGNRYDRFDINCIEWLEEKVIGNVNKEREFNEFVANSCAELMPIDNG